MHDLVGDRFGRLTVQKRIPGGTWMCLCDCGEISYATTGNLKRGNSRSCGCLWKERITTHGHTGTVEYKAWRAMRWRCKTNHPRIRKLYKDRGITFCKEWEDYSNFLRDMGCMPTPGLVLDRKDGDKGYEKDNCRWTTQQQNMNNRRNCRYIEYQGRRQTLTEWAVELNVNPRTLGNRISRGWPVERAFAELGE